MKKFIIFIFVGLALVSCNDLLEEHPKSVAAETFYNTVQEASSAVLAPLNKLRGEFNGMSYPTMQEASAPYCYGRGSWTEISNYEGLNTSSNITRAGTIWSNLYGAVRDCNIAISRLPEAKEMTEKQKAAFLGELRFIRAFSYFYLVRLYGACPLRTEHNMNEYNLSKTSVTDIYKFIINDLEFAEANAPEKAREAGTPTLYAAMSLLADVYMNIKDYKNAAIKAKKVIDSKVYSLVPVATSRDFEKVFGGDVVSTSEEVFYLKNENATGDYGWPFVMICSHPKAMVNGQYMLGNGLGWYGIYATAENAFIKEWNDKDLRKAYNLLPLNFGIGNTYLFSKFYDPKALNKNGAGNDFPVLRYPDVLFDYAEALARVNGAPTAESIEMVNKVHRRAFGLDTNKISDIDYKLSDYATLDKFLKLLVKEEGYECMAEAKSWLYICRLGLEKDIIKEYKEKEVKSKHLMWPIPMSEFNYNSALDPKKDQNAGY